MYYIVKQKGNDKHTILHIEDTNDATYHTIKDSENIDDVLGQFGRKDYAKGWVDYLNSDIKKEELQRILGL